ncbi:esterase/lipase [Ilyonectria destructans]|nr:esterase/lipase [Ilyonectria destructans]
MTADTYNLKHPLGNILGRDGDVVCFRGIPYATLKDRLSEAQLIEQYSGPVDATRFGPVSPSPPGAFQLEMVLMQQSCPEPETTSSDLFALNLNIWVPKIDGQLPAENTLPIVVWVHGGGFVSGANSWPQYDMTRLVKLSVEKKMPIIGVSINFRLGFLGNLTSAALRSAGYKPNNQLRDQRVAFAWLHKYIAGFGGVPSEITVTGESTGAVATGLHLQSQQPLFARAIMTGGSPLLIPPSNAEHQEWVYEQVVEALSLQSAPSSEQIQALLTLPMAELATKLTKPLPYKPMVDGELIPFPMTYAMVADRKSNKISGKHWLKGLMVGDCQFDASSLAIFMAHVKAGISKTFPDHLRTAFPSNAAVEELLEMYGFRSSAIDDDLGFRKFLDFFNDLGYYAATVSFARGWSPECHAFFINERNPWKGMFQGEATHIVDAILLFQNFNDDLPPAMKEAAIQLAVDVFTFIGGRPPWPSCNNDTQCAKVYGPSSWDTHITQPSSMIVDDVVSDNTGRRREMIDIGSLIGLDELGLALAAFVAS